MVKLHTKRFRALIVSTALLVVLVTLITSAEARTESPQAPVYSDSSVARTVGQAGTPSEGQQGGVSPYAGTGQLTADSGVSRLAPNVKDLLALQPMTGANSKETIIGFDTRVRTYTTSFPARAVVLITFTGGRCTGWLYGSNVVATAGHCVHDGAGGTWHTNVRVYPGYDGNVAPFGSCAARWLASVNGWVNSSDEEYDYGVIKLNCTVGNTTGWFGFWWQGNALNGFPTIVSGYPGDKPLTQWWSFDQVRVTGARQVFYLNDSIGGMSGSPVWEDRPPGSPFCANGPCTMAIHAYGLHDAAPHGTNNHGTRIVQPVYNNLIAWRNAP